MSEPVVPAVVVDEGPAAPVHVVPPRRLNALFVLSAICMIFGLFALNGSLDYSPLPAQNLLVLVGVLNAYEAMTLAIAYLLHRRGIAIDARTLVVIEALFVFDGAFLMNELITVMPAVGRPMAVVMMLAGALKLGVMLHIVGVRLLSRPGVLAMAMMLVLALLPASLRAVADRHAGALTPLGYYAGWWIATAAILAGAALWRREQHSVVHAMIAIGMVSVVAHIATAGWVNKVPYTAAAVAPMVLGLSVLIGHARLFVLSRDTVVRLELLLPVLAVAMSGRVQPEMAFDVGGIAMTPLRLALLGAVLVYVHGLLRHRDPVFGLALVSGTVVAGAGATTRSIGMTATDVVHMVGNFINRMIPRTLVQWGWISVASAFALLIGGAFASMRRQKAE